MTKMNSAGCLVAAIGLVACVDAPGDTTDDVSQTKQAGTVYDQCAVGDNDNGQIESINVEDTLTRNFNTMNGTGTHDCNCINWQQEANATSEAHANTLFPKCRPTTFVETLVADSGAYDIGALVTSWHAMENGRTECLNSTLNVKVQKFNWTTHEFETMIGGASGDLHPTFSNGACNPVGFQLQVLGSPDDFRVRARATRGLGTAGAEHGFEAVEVFAYPNDVISG